MEQRQAGGVRRQKAIQNRDLTMKIGGLNKFSLSDFPGRVAAVVFTQGCNFRCPYCHNGSLVPRNTQNHSLIPEERLLQFLKAHRDQLDGVVISGGEPTIQADLFSFIQRLKAEGFLVKLDTNGSRPHVLHQLLKGKLLDYMAMDIKAPLDIYDRLSGVRTPINRIRESIELIARSNVAHEFRTTVVEPLLSPEDVESIKKLVPPGSAYRLQKFCPEHTLDPLLRKQRDITDESKE